MQRDVLTKIIEAHQNKFVGEPRDYIGASIIGSDCLRQIWYEFKGEKGASVPSKTLRTWDVGRALEGIIVAWLLDAGVRVERLPTTWISERVPSFRGHVDALVFIGEDREIVEIKTAKDASFKVFVNKGTKIWNPQYYAQVQSYMGLMGIRNTYVLVFNKDGSDLSDELIEFDPVFYASLEDKALMISKAVIAPPKINGSPLFYKCKLCKFNKTCHQ